jgi:hypothetical protein
MSKVQGPDEGDQRTHLPPATEVEMSEVRQGQDAEAKGEVRFVIHTIASWRRPSRKVLSASLYQGAAE